MNPEWFKEINPSTINLGAGARSLAKNGIYVSK